MVTAAESVAPAARIASVQVRADEPAGDIRPLWAAVGYDEINWTYTAAGTDLLGTIGAFAPQRYYIRPHYIFCSGNGLSLPHWGSGNVYHTDEQGRPYYDFTIADLTYDAILAAGHRPLVELGFTPRALVPEAAEREFAYHPSPTQYSPYEAGLWAFPPKDYGKWAGLVEALAAHCRDRYGEAEVNSWLWELWNEPDIFYWQGTPEQFHELYAVTARAVRSALPQARVGGPATTGDASGPPFLRGFLAYCAEHDLPLDFVSCHTKGAMFDPWRCYGPTGAPAPVRQSPSMLKMLREVRASLAEVAALPQFRDLPVMVDECDASVPAHWGSYDNSNFAYRNTEYYPVFQCKLMKKLHDLNEVSESAVDMAMTWSFYFEGERYFEGTRSLMTTSGIEKPVLNAYRMLSRLHERRLRLRSSDAWDIGRLDEGEPGMPAEVDGLATTDGRGRYAVLVWRHSDDQYADGGGDAGVAVTLSGLPGGDRPALVRHWRIDREHSNSHTAWQALGAPQRPTADQVAAIKRRQGLAEYEPERRLPISGGSLTLDISLPLPGVSLLEIELEVDR